MNDSEQLRDADGLARVNALSTIDAEATFRSCCGATAFATQMAAARPFASLEAMKAKAAAAWGALGEGDWDEAFRAHPEIGGKKAEGPQTQRSASWSSGEQAQVPEAAEATRLALAEVNVRYRERFGRIYIVCATGKTAEELLAIAHARMANTPEVELRAAAEEQRKITELRLEKLVRGQ
ncbi:MAG: 2-oxo-4-hydroxy-4-carboxy-5-ureidoimidazoline decarboxylase [Myxococcales bacterium]|nr:2-oxo-4-hydroxy-4-carboxy-5-ureidoimidazoline decarboxylase [Myxococcales bacterium]